MHLLASIFLSLAMIIGGTASSAFADEQVTGSDRFKLWNECRSVFLVVEGLPNEAKEIGLRKDAIEVAVRSRLRGARIYLSSLDRPYLYVRVNLVGAAFGVDLTFRENGLTIQILINRAWLQVGQSVLLELTVMIPIIF